MSQGESLLIVSDSQTNADLYYATGFLVGNTVVYLQQDGKKTLLVNDLEYGRANREARVDEVLATSRYEEKLSKDGKPASFIHVVDRFLKERQLKRLTIPASTAYGYAKRFEGLGYELEVREDPFLPERGIKQAWELEAIGATQAHLEEAMEFAVHALKESEIRGDVLYRSGEPLTSEALRRDVQKFLLDRDCLAREIIVAGGDQGTDPHRRGDGPLPANETIILDFFAQSLKTLYWGDMTRTVVRGKASPQARKLYTDVAAAQELALSRVCDGADGQEVHRAVVELFKERGNDNGEVGGQKTGFFHGTGHGVGIEIHEAPRVGRVGQALQAGQVVTIEPGLYYPGVGAVRLEDLVIVTKDGYRNLNRFEKVLEV